MEESVLLVGDHKVVLDGLELIINSRSDLNVIAKISNKDIISKRMETLSPKVIVKDITEPLLNEVQFIESLKEIYPDAKILVLALDETTSSLGQLRRVGVSGYILKSGKVDDFIRAIYVVAVGGFYLDQAVAEKLIDGYTSKNTTVIIRQKPNLSTQEQKVLRSFVQGYSNKEIAARMTISTKTVETYKARIKEKLSLKDRVDLTQYALHQGLLTVL